MDRDIYTAPGLNRRKEKKSYKKHSHEMPFLATTYILLKFIDSPELADYDAPFFHMQFLGIKYLELKIIVNIL